MMNDPTKPAFNIVTAVNLNGKPTYRQMIIFTSKGCSYKRKTGGCLFCGNVVKSNEGTTANDLKKQFDSVFKKDPKIKQIELLTQGSFFDENEFPAEAVEYILRKINENNFIKKVVTESRPEHITLEKIRESKKLLGNKILEIGIGLETVNDKTRDFLGKDFGKKEYVKALETIKKGNAEVLTYILIKPPNLTEKEAIEEAIETIKYCFKMAKESGVKARVALEPMFIAKETDLEKLYLERKYELPKLWSVIEIIKKTNKLGTIFVGLSDDGLADNRLASNCGKCDEKIIKAMEEFNATQNLRELECECKKEWKGSINKAVFKS